MLRWRWEGARRFHGKRMEASSRSALRMKGRGFQTPLTFLCLSSLQSQQAQASGSCYVARSQKRTAALSRLKIEKTRTDAKRSCGFLFNRRAIMRVFAIGDMHLEGGTGKTMDRFGQNWRD